MALLGVIGGLGPMATAYFMELVTSMTEAAVDQEHINMLIYSVPHIPDRTDYILGKSGDSPLPGIVDAGLVLKSAGVDIIAVPCVTAHYFHNEIESRVGVPMLNAIRDSAELLYERRVKTAGLMATEGTVSTGLFQQELHKKGISVVVPNEKGQGAVTSLIYDDVKRGRPPDMEAFYQVKDELMREGAEVVILGCTELSVIKRDNCTGDNILDVMDVLVTSAITACGKNVRKAPLCV